MRRLIKHALAACLYYSGLLTLADWFFGVFAKENDVCVLMYHRVIDNPCAPEEFTQAGISVSTSTFEKQIDFLQKHFRVISTAEHFECRRGNNIDNRRKVVITFDDGWIDNIENAYPILKSHSASATIFVCSDFVGTKSKFWFHSIGYYVLTGKLTAKTINGLLSGIVDGDSESLGEELMGRELLDQLLVRAKSLSPMQIELLIQKLRETSCLDDTVWISSAFVADWETLLKLDPALITLGSHGCSHKLLTAISQEEVAREISESKRKLETELGRKVEIFAYPNGDYNDKIKSLVAMAGYNSAYAVGERHSKNDNYALGRIGIHEGSALGVGNRFSPAIFAMLLSPTMRRIKSQRGRSY